MAMSQCSAIKRSGERCRGMPIHDSEYCVAHHPETQQARKVGSKKGGKRGGRGRTGPSEVRKIQAEIRSVIDDVINNALDKGTGSVAFMGYNTLLRSVEVERRLVELTQLEARMSELEILLEQQEQGGGGRYGAS